MNLITAPNPIPSSGYKVFLAGAIDMGQAENWQAMVAANLANIPDLVLLNPRRVEFTQDTLLQQIEWELDALEQADLIFMWLPSDSKAPVLLFEAGLYWKSGKLQIGAGRGYFRRANLELTALRYNVPLFDDLVAMTKHLMARLDLRRRNSRRRDELGRVVRQAWVDYCRETGDTKASHLTPYDELQEWDKEADRRIAEAVEQYIQLDEMERRAHYPDWLGSSVDRERDMGNILSRLPKAVSDALEIALRYGQEDGSHHKLWCIDQMVRALAGEHYHDLIRFYEDGEDGPHTYEWEQGIAP